jgi:hypothetical protein
MEAAGLATYAATATTLEAECRSANAAALAAFSATIPTGTAWSVAPMCTPVPRILFFALYPPKQPAGAGAGTALDMGPGAGADPYDNSTCRAIQAELLHSRFMFVDLLPLAPLMPDGPAAAARASELYDAHGNASGVSAAAVARALHIRRGVHSQSLPANAVQRLLAAVRAVRAAGHPHPVVAVCGEVAAAHWRKAPGVVQRAVLVPPAVTLWQDAARGGAAFMVVHITHPSAQWHGSNRAAGRGVLVADLQAVDALSAAPLCGSVRNLAAWARTAGSPAHWRNAVLGEFETPRAAEVHFYDPAVRASYYEVAAVLGVGNMTAYVLCGHLNKAHFAEDVLTWVRALGVEAARPALQHAAFAQALIRAPGVAVAAAIAWTRVDCAGRMNVVGALTGLLADAELAPWVEAFIGTHGAAAAYPVLANPELGTALLRRHQYLADVVDAWSCGAYGGLAALATPGFVPRMRNDAFMASAWAWAGQGKLYTDLVHEATMK